MELDIRRVHLPIKEGGLHSFIRISTIGGDCETTRLGKEMYSSFKHIIEKPFRKNTIRNGFCSIILTVIKL